jgi:hypothetical protein
VVNNEQMDCSMKKEVVEELVVWAAGLSYAVA